MMGQIFQYLKNPGVYRCPADHSTYVEATGTVLPLGGGGDSRVRSMSMNAWLNPDSQAAGGLNNQYIIYKKDSMLTRPGSANLWLFIDENPYSINDGFFEEDPGSSGWIDCPATYHDRACGIAFCDGHAQVRKWTDGTVLGWNVAATGAPHGTLSADLNWLLSMTTVHN